MSEHDSVTSRRYKENWDDACELLNAQDTRIGHLEAALKGTLDELMEHPTFWPEAFEDRDFSGLVEEGGDCAFVTMMAISIADALREVSHDEWKR